MESDLSMTEIAYRWGFSDPAYFYKKFRSAVGVSPVEYRKKKGDNIENAAANLPTGQNTAYTNHILEELLEMNILLVSGSPR